MRAAEVRLTGECDVGGLLLRWSSFSSDWRDAWLFVADPSDSECEASLCEHRPLNVSLMAETESGCKWDGSSFDLSSSQKEMGMIFGNGEVQLIYFSMRKESKLNPPKTRPAADPDVYIHALRWRLHPKRQIRHWKVLVTQKNAS